MAETIVGGDYAIGVVPQQLDIEKISPFPHYVPLVKKNIIKLPEKVHSEFSVYISELEPYL